MKVLVIGGGGREHAIAASVAKSPKAEKIYCAPGNAGIAQLAECVPIGAMEFDRLTEFAKEKEIDLVIVGMDDPLVGGLVDQLEAAGIRAFGPRKNAAILEGSKAFSKELMKKYNIPTAAYEVFDKAEDALEYLHTKAKFPIVLKADGLALGKGVLICSTLEEAEDGVCTIMTDKKFGTAGNKMVIEEFMTGREVSVLSFTDGKTIQIFNYGNCKRDFTYVDDIVEGVVRIMQHAPEKQNGEDGLPIPAYKVYNIGNNSPENLLDFVSILQEELIRAKVPLGEMFGYATDLRSQTQGRASYTMQFDSYEPAPKSIVDEVMSKNA